MEPITTRPSRTAALTTITPSMAGKYLPILSSVLATSVESVTDVEESEELLSVDTL